MIDISGKCNVLVLGYGVSGKSIYKFLKEKGHDVFVFEDSDADVPDRITDIDWNNIDFLVKSPSIPFMSFNCHHVVEEAIKNGIPVISCFDVFRLHNPDAKIVAITGTNGKSTTTALIHHILNKSGVSVKMGGNIGIPYNELPKADVYIFEMSSYELASSKYLDFDIAAVLNVEPDHLQFHGDFDNYVFAKHLALENSKSKIVSYEDFVTMSKYKDAADVTTLSFRDNNKAAIHIYEGALMDSGMAVIDLTVLMELRGKHNHQNALFAYQVCKQLGLQPKEIAKNMQSFKALPHRLNTVRKIKNVLFVNDSKATNPGSSARALDTFVGYKIFWLVGGRSKKIDVLKFVEPHLDSIQKIYLFGESEDEFKGIFSGLRKVVSCGTMGKALEMAYKDASNEEGPSVVLLSPMCASFDQFDSFEHRGNEFVQSVMELI